MLLFSTAISPWLRQGQQHPLAAKDAVSTAEGFIKSNAVFAGVVQTWEWDDGNYTYFAENI